MITNSDKLWLSKVASAQSAQLSEVEAQNYATFVTGLHEQLADGVISTEQFENLSSWIQSVGPKSVSHVMGTLNTQMENASPQEAEAMAQNPLFQAFEYGRDSAETRLNSPTLIGDPGNTDVVGDRTLPPSVPEAAPVTAAPPNQFPITFPIDQLPENHPQHPNNQSAEAPVALPTPTPEAAPVASPIPTTYDQGDGGLGLGKYRYC